MEFSNWTIGCVNPNKWYAFQNHNPLKYIHKDGEVYNSVEHPKTLEYSGLFNSREEVEAAILQYEFPASVSLNRKEANAVLRYLTGIQNITKYLPFPVSPDTELDNLIKKLEEVNKTK